MSFKPIDPKPDFPKIEQEILKFWEENKIFEKSLEKTKDGKPYTFYDGPPFATGLPHYGHILASTIKDVIPRYQTMKGRFVRRRWGWDTHGLPIEEIVERELKISGKKQIEELGIEKFNAKCREMVLQFVDEWRNTVRRIARWVDFDNSYKTMDRDYMESVWWAFKQIYDQGLVYEGRKVLLYCPRCETPLSNFEVAMDNSYQEVTEEAVTVKFQISNNKSQINSKFQIPNSKTYLLAWTTTPWTLPGNVALAVGEKIDYVKIKIGDENYILAKDRLASIFPDTSKFDDRTKQTLKGKDLIGLEYEPLFEVSALKTPSSPPLKRGEEKNSPLETGGVYKVYAADFVNTEEGTGIVHTAVVYGEDDYNLGLKEGLPVIPLLDEKGKFNDKAPAFVQGQYFKDADKIIKQDLEKRGLLFERSQHRHSYPHCWRCGTALYYNAIPAWFINIQKIKKDLLKTNQKQMNWYPEHLKHGRYEKSVEAAPDWNISRNRYWGNPIPVWKCEDCEKSIVVGSVEELGLKRNTFYFLRHAESEKNISNIVNGSKEHDRYDLTKQGAKQAENLAKSLKKNGEVDLILTSDFLRTKKTADIIGEKLDIEVRTDERIREINVGEFEGQSEEKYQTEFASRNNRWTKAPVGGETLVEVQKRVVDFVQDINQKYEGKKILVVSHGDPLLVLQKYFGSERPYPKYAETFEIDVSIVDLHRPYIDKVVLNCKHCGGKSRRIPEIFDSWVEAGSMPFAEYHYPFENKKIFESRLPAQFVAEYIAQTRAWFYVMHVISQILFKQAPFENVVTTGTILAEDGSKMSKSKNNFPDPWEVIEKYGVDSLRFYLMNSVVMQADNLNFSEKDLATVHRKISLILWNIYNYFVTYANEAEFEPDAKDLELEQDNVLDQWIVIRTDELINEVTNHLDSYSTVKSTRAIQDYLNDLSTWYLRRSRGRKDKDFFEVLRHSLLVTSRVLSPFMPYLSEEIFRNLTRRDIISVHLTDWFKLTKISKEDKQILDHMLKLRSLVEQGHSLRKAKQVKLRQPLAKFSYFNKDKKSLPSEFEKILADELNVRIVQYSKDGKADFDWELTPELKKEGLARDLERLVQQMRKDQGLKVGETVILSYDTDDQAIKKAFTLFDTKKTYIKEIREDSGGGEELEIEGRKLSIGLTK